jgi:hypothetical protein
MEKNPNEVLSWLGRDSAGASYPLVALNLTWSAQGVQADLAAFEGVAQRLVDDPELWSALLRETNWRFTLVGCVCLLVSDNQDHWEDLAWRFDQGTWISPQLAVTMGLLHPTETLELLARLLEEGALSDSSKGYGAALVVRARLDPDITEPADLRLVGDAAEGASVAEAQWAFWSDWIQTG